MWFLLIDAYSKWPEIQAMPETTTEATIQQLCKIFSAHGLPEQITTDNGPQFVTEQFEKFCRSRGIQHNSTAPYHPHSNGEVETNKDSELLWICYIHVKQLLKRQECIKRLIMISILSYISMLWRYSIDSKFLLRTMLDSWNSYKTYRECNV